MTERQSLFPSFLGLNVSFVLYCAIERLLELCNPKAYVVILGGTAPLSRVLFDYGFEAISGTKVI